MTRAAGLFDRLAGAGGGARHFDVDLGGDGALAEQTNAVAALVRQAGLAQHIFGDLAVILQALVVDRLLDAGRYSLPRNRWRKCC